MAKTKDPVSIGGDKEFVWAGSYKGDPLIIGRLALSDGQVALGHIHVIGEVIDVLAYGMNGIGIVNGGPYEVLVYDPTFNEYQDANGRYKKTVNVYVYYWKNVPNNYRFFIIIMLDIIIVCQ